MRRAVNSAIECRVQNAECRMWKILPVGKTLLLAPPAKRLPQTDSLHSFFALFAAAETERFSSKSYGEFRLTAKLWYYKIAVQEQRGIPQEFAFATLSLFVN